MSQVLEVSQGLPTDGRMFETPSISVDNQQPRYITFVGNLVERDAVRDRAWLKGGGIEIANPCLRYVKNFVRKGRITPVLKDTHDYRPADLVKKANEGDSSFFPQPIPPGYVPPLTDGGAPSKYGYMMGKLALPGEQIDRIVNGEANILANVRRGVVELTTLRTQPYQPRDVGDGVFADPTIWEMQRAIFPTYPILPVLLDELESMLNKAWQHTMLREIVEDFQTSLQQFRDYANATIKKSHLTMREIASKTSGYIPTYTAVDIVLLEQLGMARQDEDIRRAATSPIDTEFKDMFKAFIESQKEEKLAMAALFKSQTVNENTMAAAAIPEYDKGYDGYPGQSGYSGFSGEVAQEIDASTMIDTQVNPPKLHWKVRQKMEREAAAAVEEPTIAEPVVEG